jgi:hypothetical protein
MLCEEPQSACQDLKMLPVGRAQTDELIQDMQRIDLNCCSNRSLDNETILSV